MAKRAANPKRSSAATDLMHPATGAVQRLSKVQKFRVERISRGDIKTVPWNPRTIDKAAKKRLEKILRKTGLVDTLVYNKRSGNLVGGHQRLSIIDAIEGSPNFSLDVAVVDIDDAAERELNVALNASGAQSVFDAVKLEDLFSGGADLSLAFDEMELQVMFPESDKVKSMFSLDSQPEAVKDTVKDLGELAEMKRRKNEWKAKSRAADDTEFHCSIVFRDREHREKFMALIGMAADDRYVSGETLMAFVERA